MTGTKVVRMGKDGQVVEEVIVDFRQMKADGISDDPIAFYYGISDRKLGKKLPKKNSEEYKELDVEYIRGYKKGAEVIKKLEVKKLLESLKEVR